MYAIGGHPDLRIIHRSRRFQPQGQFLKDIRCGTGGGQSRWVERPVFLDSRTFAACLALCRRPVVYNGDIRTAADGAFLRTHYPGVNRWMIGRGLIADPFLAERLRGNLAPRDLNRLRAFLDDLLTVAVEESHGDKQVLGRFKELWGYLHLSLRHGERVWGSVKICRTLDEYHRVVAAVFEDFPGFVEDESLSGI